MTPRSGRRSLIMNRLIRTLRQWSCDHRYHATGVDCADCATGFQVECRRCGHIDWLGHGCPSDCELCA